MPQQTLPRLWVLDKVLSVGPKFAVGTSLYERCYKILFNGRHSAEIAKLLGFHRECESSHVLADTGSQLTQNEEKMTTYERPSCARNISRQSPPEEVKTTLFIRFICGVLIPSTYI
jgi:hypothetical protein